jgi:hypothetical protein
MDTNLSLHPRISHDALKVYHPRPDLITLRSVTRDSKLNDLQNLPQISQAARQRRAWVG